MAGLFMVASNERKRKSITLHRCERGVRLNYIDTTPYQDRPKPAAYAHLRGIAAGGQLHASVADLARWVSFQFRTEDAPRAGAQVFFNEPTRTGAILHIDMWPPHGGLDLAQEILELILTADEARGNKGTTTDFSPVPETYRARHLGEYRMARRGAAFGGAARQRPFAARAGRVGADRKRVEISRAGHAPRGKWRCLKPRTE
jgi:hypothetical protein